MPLGREVGLGPGDIVLDGNPAAPPQKGTPQLSAHVYCGETAVCIRTPLGIEVGLSLGDIVLVVDGDPAPSEKRRSPTQFLAHVYCGQTAGWIKMPLGTKVNLGPDNRHGPKRGGGCCAPFAESWDPI